MLKQSKRYNHSCRLLQFASRSVEFHRGLQGTEVERNLALLLMLLSIHLLHYASLGGSAALSSRSALEEAQETAKEAAGKSAVSLLAGQSHFQSLCPA